MAGLVVGLALAAALGFTAISKNMMYFYTPSDVVAAPPDVDARIRLGGLVVAGSLPRDGGRYHLNCAVIVKKVDEKTRAKTGINELLRDAQQQG